MKKQTQKKQTLYGVKIGEAIMTLTEAEFDNYKKVLAMEKSQSKKTTNAQQKDNDN